MSSPMSVSVPAAPAGPVGGITVDERAGSTVVVLLGEIDHSLRPQASRALSQIVARPQPLVLVTGGVTFIDSSGIAFLIQCATLAAELGVPVTLPEPAPAVAQVLRLVAAEDLFTSDDPTDTIPGRTRRPA